MTGKVSRANHRRRRLDQLMVVATLGLAIPFIAIAVRLATSTRHVFLSDDLALIDVNTRDAFHFRQQLGPWDRFGWRHPGASYFYLLAAVARAVGSGPRADFLGAVLINGLAALAIVWVIRRAAGRWPALWSALCIGLLAAIVTARTPVISGHVASEASVGALVSPWDPLIVVLPLVLFATLCTVGVLGSWNYIVGASLVGSFVVQTNIGTLPIVGTLFLVTLSARLLPWDTWLLPNSASRGSSDRPDHIQRKGVANRWWVIVGLLTLLVMWLPTIVEQATNQPGNLTLIWRFFVSHSQPHSLSRGLDSIGAIDSAPAFALSHPFRAAGGSLIHSLSALTIVVVVAAVGVTVGVIRHCHLGVFLAVGSLLGIVVSVVSATRVVGPIDNYLIYWELGIPILAILAVGISALDEDVTAHHLARSDITPSNGTDGSDTGPALASPVNTRHTGSPWRALLVVAFSFMVAVLMVDVTRLPPMSRASDNTVEAAWRLVAPALHGTRGVIEVGLGNGTSFWAFNTMAGLFDQLAISGYQPCVSPFWKTALGVRHLCQGNPQVTVLLDPRSLARTSIHGFIGYTSQYAVQVSRTH